MPPVTAEDDDVRRWILTDFGVAIATMERFGGGLDPDATVWRASDDSGRSWAVKWTARDNRFGLRLASSLGSSGVAGVPEVLSTTSGRPWSERGGGRLALTAWIEGEDAFDSGLTPSQWQSLGSLVRRIHDHPVPQDDADPTPRTGRHGIRRAGTYVKRRLIEIDDLVATLPETASDGVREFAAEWTAARPRIDALRAHAVRLRRRRAPAPRVSCHGDPHLGNVVVDSAGTPWLIDFDDAVRAPKEVDLMLVEFGVLFSVPVRTDEREAFRRGYGETSLDGGRLLRFGCVRAVEDLVETAYELLTGHSASTTDELRALFAGILSREGLAGTVERRLPSI